jgi:hypothetical protein
MGKLIFWTVRIYYRGRKAWMGLAVQAFMLCLSYEYVIWFGPITIFHKRHFFTATVLIFLAGSIRRKFLFKIDAKGRRSVTFALTQLLWIHNSSVCFISLVRSLLYICFLSTRSRALRCNWKDICCMYRYFSSLHSAKRTKDIRLDN